MTTTTEFLAKLFAHTEKPVYLCSFPNERNDESQAGERHILTRKPVEIEAFIKKWDRAGRGMFFCVGTVEGNKRHKPAIVETIGLHVDVDFKSLEAADGNREIVARKMKALPLPPSAIVESGNGMHGYWLFMEPMDAQTETERIESALRQLSDLLGGDLAVCEISRVMRLPGTHNTKNDGFVAVELVELHPDRRYELDDLEDMLAELSPVLLRKVRERGQTVGELDPWAQYVKDFGFKAPIDVEQALAQMMFMGGGEASIHQTQLVVTASLLSRGMAPGEVVSIVLEATKIAAGAYGGRWNWRREERKIVGMCDTWLQKHPQPTARERSHLNAVEKSAPPDNLAEQPDSQAKPALQVKVKANGEKVVQLAPQLLKKEEQHQRVGQVTIDVLRRAGKELISTKDGIWFYQDGVWELRTEPRWLNANIESAIRALGFTSTTKLRNEARAWIEVEPTVWSEVERAWDQHGKVPTRSGLIDPRTGELEPAKPEHYCTWRIPLDYDPQAKAPWWLMMLDDMFGDKPLAERAALIRVVQECFGASLIDRKSRALSKALVFWGGENLGKSGPLEIAEKLFGASIGAPIDSVEGTHGMMPFGKRAPWVLHEAFKGNWSFSSVVKAIITQEPVMINIKNGPMLTQIVRTPIFWATNFQPQFKEATRAIVSRMIVIEVSRKFDPDKPMGAAAEAIRRGYGKPGEMVADTELQGVLNWALDGLRRALERGSIATTESIRATADAIHKDSNLAAGFMEECVEFDRNARLRVADFCLAHSAWWLEGKGEDRRLPTNEAIGKAMKALNDGRVGMDRTEMRDTNSRYYCGVAFNKIGLRYHRAAYESRLFEGKIATATDPQQEVNGIIPLTWDAKPSVVSMRRAHGVEGMTVDMTVYDRSTENMTGAPENGASPHDR